VNTITPILSERARIEGEAIVRPKNRPVSEEIGDELREAAAKLNILADLSDMQFARCEREQKEEASAFVAFLGEVCRPMDEAIRNIMVIASDNTGAIGEAIQPTARAEADMTLTIDTHIPPPLFWNRLKRKGQSSELREALHRLKVGESVFDDKRTANNINVQIYQAQIRTGRTFIQRPERNGHRIWRVE